MSTSQSPYATPLSEDEQELLADLLDEHAALSLDELDPEWKKLERCCIGAQAKVG